MANAIWIVRPAKTPAFRGCKVILTGRWNCRDRANGCNTIMIVNLVAEISSGTALFYPLTKLPRQRSSRCRRTRNEATNPCQMLGQNRHRDRPRPVNARQPVGFVITLT